MAYFDFKTQQKYSLNDENNPIGTLCLISFIFALVFEFITHHDMNGPLAICMFGYVMSTKEAIRAQVSNVYRMIDKYEQLCTEKQKSYNQQSDILALQQENEKLKNENKNLITECQHFKSKYDAIYQRNHNENINNETYLFAMRGILIRNKDKLKDEIIVHNDDGYDDPHSYIIDIELLKYPKIGHYKVARLSG